MQQNNGARQNPPPPPKREENRQKPPPPPKREENRQKPPPAGEFKNPLHFLPREVYNPESRKFFGKISAEDILLMGLILLILDRDCTEDFALVLALLYILFSDFLDFGNIFS